MGHRVCFSGGGERKKTTAEQSFIATIFTPDYPTDSLMKETDGAPKALWEEAKWGNY